MTTQSIYRIAPVPFRRFDSINPEVGCMHMVHSISSTRQAGLPAPPEHPAGSPLAGNIMVRALNGDPEQWYFLYVPRNCTVDTPVFVSVHGITRNASDHAILFAPFAERYGVVLVAPLFTRQRYRDYQRLGTGDR